MISKLSPQCLEALDARLLQPAGGRSAQQSHRRDCPACAEAAAMLDDLSQTLRQTDTKLDDLSRARVLGRLERTVREVAGVKDQVPRSRTRLVAAVAGPVLLAGLLLGLLRSTAPLRSTAAPPGTRPEHRVLTPYSVEGAPGPPWLQRLLGQRVGVLEVPPGIEVRSLLTERAAMALVGPARLEVIRAEPGHVVLRLAYGTMVASYDGNKGGLLEVQVHRTVVEVVGTLFMVQAQKCGLARVAVAHGRVRLRVRNGTEALLLGERQAWSSDRGLRSLIPAERVLMTRLEASSTPDTSPASTKWAPPAPHQPASQEPAAPACGPADEASMLPGRAAPARRKDRTVNKQQIDEAAGAHNEPERLGALQPELLYRQAEKYMRQGDRKQARRSLELLVRCWKDDALADQARYELAHIALRAGLAQDALLHLRELPSTSKMKNELLEATSYLRCRAQLHLGARQRAATCLSRFRTRFPRSPHDEAALAELMTLLDGDPDKVCSAAGEYLSLYPTGPHAELARSLRARCRR